MRIDAHQHFWKVARGDYGWLTPNDHRAICRDFLPKDLEPLLKDARVDRTVLVQAAPTFEETRFLLQLADETNFVAGVVGWVDFDASDAADTILNLGPQVLGLRPMIQDIPDERWMLSPSLRPALEAIHDADITFDALVKPAHLPVLREFLTRDPELDVVIDHGGKPQIASGNFKSWAFDLRAIARDSRSFCKLSGLMSEARAGASAEDLRPYVDVLLEAFGPRRLMWGSDWPVLNEVSTYPSWISIAEELTQELSVEDREQIFGGAAARFYGLSQ